jgi:hypothetical protein
VEHLISSGSDLECDGGQWQFDWAGKVPGESADAQALLAGDAMYYTQDERGGWRQRPSLRGQGMECTAPAADGKNRVRAFRGIVKPGGESRMDVQMSMASANPYLSISAHDVAICAVQLASGQGAELPFDLGLFSGSATLPTTTRFAPAFRLTREEVEQGFDKTWRVSADQFLPGAAQCLGQRMNGEVRVRFKVGADDPEIDFDACLNLARGEVRTVSAKGTPAGGTYRFAANPGSLMRVNHAGPTASQAEVTAASPGRGEFTATYARRGKQADKTVPASVVDLFALEAGGDEIELGLMDTEGRPIDKPLRVPFRSDPPAAGDLLVFKADNPKPLSVATDLNDVTIQAVAPGTAVVRAETLCGTRLGPSLKVRVVRCDKKTREELERKKSSLKERTQSILRQVADILTDDEFNRVEKEIKDDTINLWIKTSESIAGTLSLAQAQRVKGLQAAYKNGNATQAMVDEAIDLMEYTPAIEAATKAYDYYDTSIDILDGVEAGINLKNENINRAEAYDGLAKGALAALAFVAPDAVGLGKSYGEAAMAAEKMGQNLGTMLGAADRLADLDVQHANILWEAERVGRFLKRCDAKTDQPEDKKPGKRKPKRKQKQAEEPQVEPTPADTEPEPTTKEEIVDQKGPKPRRMTLPMCAAMENSASLLSARPGADSSKKLRAGATMEASPKGLANALRAEQQAMKDMATKLRERAAVAEGHHQWVLAMRKALAQVPEELQARVPALRRQLEQAIQANALADDATRADMKALQSCPEALPGRALDLRSVEWKLGP